MGYKRFSNRSASGTLKQITAKRESVCSETGNKINIGDSILWVVGTKDVYCSDSKEYRDYFSNKFDEEVLNNGVM